MGEMQRKKKINTGRIKARFDKSYYYAL